ncbi:type IA DNA topoisomerase [Acidilutibacter cellobiosedens]|jgi:DNA topoisomerase-3|uniref:DNA topoisomerase n=1 Tax=Acidilutibacter cellobiosedens TaxID=2507161 RepID=A0A410QAF5_9FIRM|nr:type IA DNA topoisomerase [Acidilutibacter cellobiosedens]MBE6081392.1 DNA topoisomerase III [Tissierellaceae bacterium]QAT60965.1 type IA DNA topoisomerase [Acidilutibacter cellobiosedens]
MKLVIAEKPSVAQSIAAVIGATDRKDGYMEGKDFLVSWCVGHLVELASADSYDEKYAKWQYEDLPILPPDWKYVISKGKEKQMKIIGELMKRTEVTQLVAATDAGREGELIFRLVYEKLSCKKPVKRLWISSMEESAIAEGFRNLRNGSDYELLYQSALCRAKADWIVGINATRLFSVLYGQTLNVGRVMSPTLAMMVEREENISAFRTTPFYTVQLDLGGFMVSGEKLQDKKEAEILCNDCDGQNVTIETVEQKEKSEKPPKLYDLTTLQREANRQLGFTAEQTLEYVQNLYEKKLVTYPRTDSRYLTEDMKDTVPAVVETAAGFFSLQNPSVNMKQVIDNSKVSDHHAIIPTMSVKNCDIQSLPYGEQEILRIIALRLVCAVGESCRYAETVITAKCNSSVFSAKGKSILDDGWKSVEKLYLADKKEQTQEEKDAALPHACQGEVFSAKATIKEGKTSPPKHFTDDTLLSAMENANNAMEDAERKGIGTPATRAGILEKLIKTGLAERKGEKKTKYFIPTPKGISLITVLPEAIKSVQLTAEWEEQLKQIERGTLSPKTFLESISYMTKDLVSTYEVIKEANTLFPSKIQSIGQCPRCKGSVIENKKGFCCENRNCGFALWKESKFFTAKKKALTKAIATELLKKGKAILTGCYSEKTGKTYDAVIILDDTGGQYVNFKMEFPAKKGGKK